MTDPSTTPDKIPIVELLEEYRRVVLATHDMTAAIVDLADSVDACSITTETSLREVRDEVRELAARRPVASTVEALLKGMSGVVRTVLETTAGKTIAAAAAVGALVSFLSAIGLSPEVIGGILRAMIGGAP